MQCNVIVHCNAMQCSAMCSCDYNDTIHYNVRSWIRNIKTDFHHHYKIIREMIDIINSFYQYKMPPSKNKNELRSMYCQWVVGRSREERLWMPISNKRDGRQGSAAEVIMIAITSLEPHCSDKQTNCLWINLLFFSNKDGLCCWYYWRLLSHTLKVSL